MQATSASSSDSSSISPSSPEGATRRWIDRDDEHLRRLEQQRRTDAYVELHRRPSTHSDLGLYGGEAGFEKTPRVWVDPDNPHVDQVFNLTPLATNIQWMRYGHFKRELHIIDIDKLCRHARLLPSIDKLLTDLVTMRVALDDEQCAALIRHGARSYMHLVGTDRENAFFQRIQQCFERFLAAITPPMHAGPKTHADMIRVCALGKRWEEGFHHFRQRAVEQAEAFAEKKAAQRRRFDGDEPLDQDSFFYEQHQQQRMKERLALDSRRSAELETAAARDGGFELDSNFYDAVLDLCVACEKYDEGLKQLRLLIASGHRPRMSSLTNGLIAATAVRDQAAGQDIARLVQLYQRRPNAPYYEARAAFAATLQPELLWPNLRDALAASDAAAELTCKGGSGGRGVAGEEVQRASAALTAKQRRFAAGWSRTSNPDARIEVVAGGRASASGPHFISPRMISWCILGLCNRPDASTPHDVVRLLDVAETRGVPCDYEILTFALLFCVKKGAAMAAAAETLSSSSSSSLTVPQLVELILRVKCPAHSVNVTPEMALLAVRALARFPVVLPAHAELAVDAVAASETTNRQSSHCAAATYELFQLLARLGAMATLTSRVRRQQQHDTTPAVVVVQAPPAGGSSVAAPSSVGTSWLIRTWLWCNSVAASPNGSHHVTSEALQMLRFQCSLVDDKRVAVTREIVAALALNRLAHGEFPQSVCKALQELELLVEAETEDDDSAASQHEERKEGEDARTRAIAIPLLDLVNECASILVRREKQERNDNQVSAEKKHTLSDILGLNDDHGHSDEKRATNGNRDRAVVAVSSPSLPPPDRSEYDACTSIADFLLEELSLPLARGDGKSPTAAQRRGGLLNRALAGLPSELDEGTDVADSLSAEFSPSPSTLRDLHARWTLMTDDQNLRKFGQRMVGGISPSKMMVHDLGQTVKPFDSQSERV